MRKHLLAISLLFVATFNQVFATGDPNDCEGCKDPALFNRMPGFYIYNYEELDFNRFDFPLGFDKMQTIEGHHYYFDYYANDGIKLPSGLQIVANYTNAAKVIGGEKIYEYEDGGNHYVTLKIVKNNTEIWVMVDAGSGGMYKVNMVEKQSMEQDVVADAESLVKGIRETGKASVYGIYFDSGQSEIKKESEKTIFEIARMLKANPNLKLYVVGHTDNVGTFDFNVKLSQARATAVVNALVNTSGITASRLVPFGAGPTSPVMSNTTADGQAKNRRVELVAQ
ncbi:MAG: OmpA family protein [Deferribacteres bacterium]|nr:OmpA family protein [Deferribacteres bacterium]